ncbi:MAG: clan AA aspartic protease, partial [Candidatus Eremiobacteraeota bacterium]|nr:clan AA aspartic protease [Candidatus Eremiobacteraeota bacterium]
MVSTRGIAFGAFAALLLVANARADEPDTSAPAGIAPVTMTLEKLIVASQRAQGALVHGVAPTRRELWKISFGAMTGTLTYVQSGRNFRADKTLGPSSTAWGSWGGRAWQMNANGQVTVASGLHRADEIDNSAFEHGGAGVTLLGRVKQPVDAFVVRVQPPGGRLEYRFYDAKTFRLDRFEEIRNGRRVTVILDDYRTTDGLVEPWHLHTTDGFATNDEDRVLVSQQVGTPVAPSETAIPPDRLSLIAPASLPARIPASLSGDAFVIPVKLGAYIVNCIFDSGADGVVIDSAVIAALGWKAYGRITNETAGTYVESDVVIPAMSIGNVTLNGVHARSLPFTQWTDTGKPIAGLLGYDVIRSAVWHLDYLHGTIEALPASTFTPPANARALVATFDDNVPIIGVTIEGLAGPAFVLDTGADRSVIFSRYADAHPRELRDRGLGEAMEDAFPFINDFSGVGGTVNYRPLEVGPLVVSAWSFPKWLFEVT